MIKNYLALGRYNNLIGAWLLFLPCLITFILYFDQHSSILTTMMFLFGAVIMRGAGCTINDIMDIKIDRQVERTRNRPLASRVVKIQQAIIFALIQIIMAGLMVIVFFPNTTVLLSLISLVMVGVYPLAKRFTNWPQLLLGLTFGMGIFIAASAIGKSPDLSTYLLYIMCVIWVVSFDTIYAHQDKNDDKFVGIGSSALALANLTKPFLIVSYGICYGLLLIIGYLNNLSMVFYIVSLAVAGHFIWQITKVDINNPAICAQIFHANKLTGLLIATAILFGKAF